MSLTAPRDTPQYAPNTNIRAYKVYQSTTIYAGSMVCLNTTGYAVAAANTSGYICVGRANETVDNSAGSSGDKYVQVEFGTFNWTNTSSLTIAAIGSLVYVGSDSAVTSTAGAGVIAGTVENVDSAGVWVKQGIFGPVDASALTGFESDLASTATGDGASLVGIEDAGTLYTATEVEAALAEVVKKANAALSIPAVFSMALSSITTGSTMVTFKPTTAGKITAVRGSVKAAASTTASGNLIVKIAGTAISGGVLSLTNTNCNTLGAALTGTSITGTNTFAAGDAVTINVGGAITPFTEGELNVLLFFASA